MAFNLGQASLVSTPVTPCNLSLVTGWPCFLTPRDLARNPVRGRFSTAPGWMSSAVSEPHQQCRRGTEVQSKAELAQGHTATLWQCGHLKRDSGRVLLKTPGGGGTTLSFSPILVFVPKELF